MAKIVLDGILESLSTRQDKSVKVVFATQELDNTYAAQLFQLRGNYCKILLSDNNITPMEEKMLDELTIQDGRKIKSRSQRLRASIYRMWETSQTEEDWDTFYANYMDILIADVKQKIN